MMPNDSIRARTARATLGRYNFDVLSGCQIIDTEVTRIGKVKRRLCLGLLLCASALPSGTVQARSTRVSTPSDAHPTTGFGLLASRLGAVLNSDLRTGGGTDDTSALQAVLDRAAHGTPVHLVIDGAALVSGLNVYGNTTVECINGGGLYLKDGSSRSIIRNVHRSRDAIVDERITVRGCFLNGNRWNQPSAMLTGPWSEGGTIPSNKEADGSFLTGLQFLGVNDLRIEQVTLWNIRAFGALIGNANRIEIKSVTIDYGAAPDDSRNYGNTDGLHFKGPLRYLTIDGLKVRTADDAIAFNANDCDSDDLTTHNCFGPYVGQGPITDVTVNNIQLMDTVWGIRLLSSSERIDRVNINNVTGSVRGAYVANISHFVIPTGRGNFGSISINDVNVDRSMPTPWLTKQLMEWVTDRALEEEFNDGRLPFISVNSQIEDLSLQNIQTRAADARPILRFGPDAKVKMMTATLRIYDPTLQATPIELDKASRIDSLNLSLFWSGASVDQGKSPIVNFGGSIGQLTWINTPPMYVSAQLNDGNVLVVTFSQDIKAADFESGVRVKVNDKSVHVLSAKRGRDMAVVHYVLKDWVHGSDAITWAYDATQGSIQNLSGGQLLSVSEKQVKQIASH